MYKSTFVLISILIVLIFLTLYIDKSVQYREFFYNNGKIKGKIASDIETLSKSQKFIFVSESNEKIIVFANRYINLNYGDKIEINGKIEKPEIFNDFDYPAFLSRQGIFYVSYYPNIILLSDLQNLIVKFDFWRFIYKIKNNMRDIINKYLPEPNASLVLATTLGDDFVLDSELNIGLVKSGLRHMVAVSGLHIAIILGTLFLFFIILGLKRNYATIAALMFLLFYVFLIGMPFSVIRAGIMGGILFLGFLIGRPSNIINSLIIAAIAIILWQNTAWQEISFQLSFGAVLGILLFFNFFQNIFKKIPKIPKFSIDILSVTMAVLILIWPISVYNFGEFSIIAPISNILVLPLLPILMILGFLVMIFGMFFAPAAYLFSWFLWLISEWVILVAEFLGSLPGATITFDRTSIWFIIIYYLLLGGILYFVKSKIKIEDSNL
ncbi:MAG: ComEC/Rec2 family competence protein [Patescibacteria group bacterium]